MPPFRRVLFVALAALAVLWIAPLVVEGIVEGDGIPDLDLEAVSRPYLAIAAFVAFDAVIPIFPSESLLNAASTLASQGQLDLGPIIIAGALVVSVITSALITTAILALLYRPLKRRWEHADEGRATPSEGTSQMP